MGHGYAIVKHPEAKKLAREKNIPIEVNPISNQVCKNLTKLSCDLYYKHITTVNYSCT
jgi:adenosine deaminase